MMVLLYVVPPNPKISPETSVDEHLELGHVRIEGPKVQNHARPPTYLLTYLLRNVSIPVDEVRAAND